MMCAELWVKWSSQYLTLNLRGDNLIVDFSTLADAVQAANGTLYLSRDTGRARILVDEGACLIEVADSPFPKWGVPIAAWCVEAFVVASVSYVSRTVHSHHHFSSILIPNRIIFFYESHQLANTLPRNFTFKLSHYKVGWGQHKCQGYKAEDALHNCKSIFQLWVRWLEGRLFVRFLYEVFLITWVQL